MAHFTPICSEAIREAVDSLALQPRLRAPAYALLHALCHMARRRDSVVDGTPIPRGTVVASLSSLAAETWLSKKTVRTLLGHFSKAAR